MVILITGASHTGKTLLAQRLLKQYKYPYLSIDHLKMGLIRSGQTALTPCDDEKLTEYLWPIVREIVKTAIENGQNLIVEGCYIPFDWQSSFAPDYLNQIRFLCLIMSERYIRTHFDAILRYENAIEKRLPGDAPDMDSVMRDNRCYLQNCIRCGLAYHLIDGEYDLEQICI